ncbi:beta-N-acetylhexosaminidase [Povalibacter sp.]|uniref:beta-N-acetylhexosaminidase n=1 Tax=Povalibacter sp. TaxID=1962978 RepID=UPI002F40B1CE
MRAQILGTLAALLCSAGMAHGASDRAPVPALMPLPAQISPGSGAFTVEAGTALVIADDASVRQVAHYFGDLLFRTRGFRPAIVQADGAAPPKKAIQFTLQNTAATAESYRLDISSQGIVLIAGDRAGLFYGAITLWQLLSADAAPTQSIRVAGVSIADQPRLRWRGLTLDSARQFQSIEFIKRFIDTMALHKLNVLQWHLADDQAWRLELRRFPQLTAVNGIGTKFYTQLQVADIVAYAAERNVTVVPSFGMPGHASAMITAYPQLAAGAETRDLLNADEGTFVFIGDVINEAAQLFPGACINLGSADFPFERWRSAPKIQARMRELGYTSERQLHDYFVKRIVALGAGRGRRIIGWDQLADAGLPVLSSRGLDGALAAVAAGHDVVVSSLNLLDFNHKQSSDIGEPPGNDAVVRLEDVYAFDPAPAALPAEDLQRLIGVHANVWTDFVRSEVEMDVIAFPRGAALAEIGWSPASQQRWASFVNRLVPQMRRYDKLGIRYSDALFRVAIIPRGGASSSRIGIELSRQASSGEIRYTLNGTEPTARSPVYMDLLEVKAPATIKAATFLDAIPLSSTVTLQVDDAALAASTISN